MKTEKQNESLFGSETLTYCYTRKMAIEDGILIDITKMAKEAGFKFPVAVTVALYDGFLTPPEDLPCQDLNGRIWDMLMMLLISAHNTKQSETRFNVSFQMQGGEHHLQELKAIVGPGDAGEPVITIMLPDED